MGGRRFSASPRVPRSTTRGAERSVGHMPSRVEVDDTGRGVCWSREGETW